MLLGLAGCQASPPPSTSASTVSSEASIVGTWGLESVTLAGFEFELDPRITADPHPGFATWVTFDATGRLEGRLPCNSISGEYQAFGRTIRSRTVVTAGSCVFEGGGHPELLMKTEEPIRNVLWSSSFEAFLDDTGSTLRIQAEDTLLTFRRI